MGVRVAFMHNDRGAPAKGFDFVTIETNSWRLAKASWASLIVDADGCAGRLAMLSARRRIMFIGWDFDARINLGRENESEGPLRLGDGLPSRCFARGRGIISNLALPVDGANRA
jgi:hypothetical protein